MLKRKRITARFLIMLPWLLFIILLPLFPNQTMNAALRGISIWWDVLFPALLPFFIIAELLLGFGLVHLIGRLFDPMMRPLFRVPGYGGFVMAMGFASGYPIGARLTSQLWEERLITRDEGERLVAFTSTSDPIFLIGAVCVGFFHDPSLAIVLAAAHYGGGILVGLCMRFHGEPSSIQTINDTPRKRSISSQSFLSQAINAMHEARMADGRPLGKLLQDAVQTALKLVFIIGALVVFISVLLELLTITGVLYAMNLIAGVVLGWFRLPPELTTALVDGLFEVTLGAKAAGAASGNISLVHQVAIAAFVLSWAGLSVHAQIISLLTRTNLRYTPFLFARFLHGVISILLIYFLWKPLESIHLAAAEWLTVPTTGGSYIAMPIFFVAWVPVIFILTLLIIPILFFIQLLLTKVIHWIRLVHF
jgi:sporulation integral membrane protein YlbJ